MIDIKEYLEQTKTVLLTQDAFDELKQRASAQPKRTEERTETHACDCISRQQAIDALWKALYEYEDKTEKQFQESDELDVGDWIQHRVFVQNMSDIDRQTIQNLPTIEAEPVKQRPKIDIDRFKKEIADYTDESGYVDIPLSILLNTLNEVAE